MKLDKQRRLKLPNILVDAVKLSNEEEVRLSVLTDKILIYNPSSMDEEIEYHDIVHLDEKNRIIFTKYVLEMINYTTSFPIEFTVSALRKQLIIRWVIKKEESI